MVGDSAVEGRLHEVVGEWRAKGPLEELLELISDVWKTNRNRQDPDLGDDAQLLGLQCHRNILNRAKYVICQVEDAEAGGAQTLEVRFGGLVLHTGKVGPRDPGWMPSLISWDGSPVRQRAARANSGVFASTVGTIFEGSTEEDPNFGGTPANLQYLHLAWQGLDEGTRAFIGFPGDGPTPWLAVMELDTGRPGTGGLPLPGDGPSTGSPNHDAMALPELSMKRRRPAAHARPQDGSAATGNEPQ